MKRYRVDRRKDAVVGGKFVEGYVIQMWDECKWIDISGPFMSEVSAGAVVEALTHERP